MNSVERIEYKGWTVEVQRKAFRRRLTIVVRPEGPIVIRSSKRESLRSICEFIEERRDWIEKCQKKFSAILAKRIDIRGWRVGKDYPFLGQMYRLKISPTPLEKAFVAIQGEFLVLHLPTLIWEQLRMEENFDHFAPLFRQFYKRESIAALSQRVSVKSLETGLRPGRLHFSETRSRWGSCSIDGTVTLNWRLIVFDPEIIDYVIVHELGHLRHMNHSKDFWQLVHGFFPRASQMRKAIREQAYLAEFLKPLD